MDGTINDHAIRSFKEVAEIMTANGFPMTNKSVWHEERRAFLKLKNDPTLRQMFLDLIESNASEESHSDGGDEPDVAGVRRGSPAASNTG